MTFAGWSAPLTLAQVERACRRWVPAGCAGRPGRGHAYAVLDGGKAPAPAAGAGRAAVGQPGALGRLRAACAVELITPIRWCMTTCPAWTTTCCAAASPRCMCSSLARPGAAGRRCAAGAGLRVLTPRTTACRPPCRRACAACRPGAGAMAWPAAGRSTWPAWAAVERNRAAPCTA